MNDHLETLKNTDTPESLLATFKAHQEAGERIRAQRYQARRESEELVAAAQATASQFVVQFGREIVALEDVRDRRLRGVEAEERERLHLPVKGEFETESEFANRLTKRAIEESRRAAAMTLHAADIQTIALTTSPAIILEIVQEAIASAPPEAVKRIARAGELRAASLAADEARDGGVPGEAFAAHLRIQDLYRHWRGQLPDAKRERILAEHTMKTMQLKTNLMAAARLLGIEKTVEAAFMKAAAHE